MAEEKNNIEELLSDDEGLQKAVNIIKNKGFVVKTTEEYNTVEETLRKEIGTHFGSKLTAIDQSLMDLGFEKEGNEPTEKFNSRVASSLKEQLDTLKQQRDEGLTGAEGLKAENESLSERLKTLSSEKEELKKGFETTLLNKEKENLVNKALSKLQFKEGIESVLSPAKKEFINTVLSNSTLEDGKLVFKDSEGVTKRNDKNEPVSVFELASKQFESVLDNTNKKEGLGGNRDNKKPSSLLSFAASRQPSNFEEIQATLKAYYKQKGEPLVNGDKNYIKGLKELREAYNI